MVKLQTCTVRNMDVEVWRRLAVFAKRRNRPMPDVLAEAIRALLRKKATNA